VEFLVQITVAMPPDMANTRRDEIVAAERARGQELVASGNIKAIWRIPGGWRNVGVWDAADATQLHDLITSLPAYPWLTAEVTPLALHPLGRVHERWAESAASDSDKDRG
jgi:muconolactone D-isomerase